MRVAGCRMQGVWCRVQGIGFGFANLPSEGAVEPGTLKLRMSRVQGAMARFTKQLWEGAEMPRIGSWKA